MRRSVSTYVLLATVCTGIGFFLWRNQYGNIIPHVPGMQRQVPAQIAEKPKRVCNVYDISAPTYDKHECLMTNWTPAFHVCIHPIDKDVSVSRNIKWHGIWEKEILVIFQAMLEKDPEYGVIDIGANIGQYALLAATMGRPVVAVEARLLHVEMVHHAIQLDNLHTKSDFTLLHNAVSDSHGELNIQLPNLQNQAQTEIVDEGNGTGIPASEVRSVPGILMDDIAEVAHFRKALLKMDIEGSEHRAVSHCEKLLKQVYIPYMFMEWRWQKKNPAGMNLIMTILARNGYSAFSLDRKALQTPSAKNWPMDIIWKHNNATF